VEEQRKIKEEADLRRGEAIVVASTNAVEPVTTANSVVSAAQAQIKAAEEEIAKRKKEQQRIMEQLSAYQAKVEAVPVREQEIADLVRDYGIGREYYSQLLAKKLAAETAMQLEARQKGEQFTILDPAQVSEEPSEPNRLVRYLAGCLAGLALGLMGGLSTEFLGTTVTSSEQVARATGLGVLGVIPILRTQADRRRRIVAVGAAVCAIILVVAGVLLLYHFQGRIS
jgi:uncharacterized protein involved in exopolysaccharide biosynthesis